MNAQRFLEQGRRAAVLADAGLSAQEIARHVIEAVARLDLALERTGD